MPAPRNSRVEAIAGFTLLEAVIATALMAMILAALATITAQWLPNWNRGVVRVQSNENIALGLERIAADLAAAKFITAGRDSQEPVFDGLDRSVTFVRTAIGPNASPGLDIVRIAEVDTEKGPVMLRTRSPFTPNAAAGSNRQQRTFSDPVVLLRMPYRLTFAYAGADRTWQLDWRLPSQLPKAIKLTVLNAAAPQAPSISTSTAVHSNLPVECVVAKSFSECLTPKSQPAQTAEDRKSPT